MLNIADCQQTFLSTLKCDCMCEIAVYNTSVSCGRYDSRVKAMEVDERPTEQYSDIGGLDKQIQEVIPSIVLSLYQKQGGTQTVF